MARPSRVRCLDFAGRPFTLPSGDEYWQNLGAVDEDRCLVLGLGPQGYGPSAKLAKAREIFFLEDPAMLSVLQAPAPNYFVPVKPDEAVKLADRSQVLLYTPALRLNPGFWYPILARIQWQIVQPHLQAGPKSIWLPGDDFMLLHRELAKNFAQEGYQVHTGIPEQAHWQDMREIWGGSIPKLVLSVNLRGLDREGRIFALCEGAHVPLAIWLVDNPWNLLSSLPLPWWQRSTIFVTDASFLGPLREAGAQQVHFLPLAASDHMFPQSPVKRNLGALPIFVGRSAFPRRDSYFAHSRPNAELLHTALTMLLQGKSPDFFWWESQYKAILWPGNGSRLPACGAEICSVKRRALWLKAAIPLEIIGDAGWREYLPDAAIQPPVDYYGILPKFYAEASCCLNVTSLLIPDSLNQRHFDVWAAGGFLFTDYTKGLEIFPKDLVTPIALAHREEFPDRLQWLRQHPQQAQELAACWRNLIAERHLYRHRVRAIIRVLTDEQDGP